MDPLSARREVADRYRRALRGYLGGDGEAALEVAYELGRFAIEAQVGVLELTACHHETLAPMLRAAAEPARAVLRAGTVLLEVLSSFEAAQRGFKEANEVLRHLNERMEQESKRIADSLHTEGGQLLVSVHLALGELERELTGPQQERLQYARKLLYGVESELRHLSHELRPALLDNLGLEPAIVFHANGVAKRSQLRVVITGSTEGRHPPQVEAALYRVVQEALQNVVRHAQATEATVFFRRDPQGLRVFVADDGVGFEAGSIVQKADRGMGLMGIRDRLGMLGGTLEISAGSNGRGTVLVAFVPLPEAAPGALKQDDNPVVNSTT